MALMRGLSFDGWCRMGCSVNGGADGNAGGGADGGVGGGSGLLETGAVGLERTWSGCFGSSDCWGCTARLILLPFLRFLLLVMALLLRYRMLCREMMSGQTR